jgi:NADH pyrophosphatase NudC (nudix superfamily)
MLLLVWNPFRTFHSWIFQEKKRKRKSTEILNSRTLHKQFPVLQQFRDSKTGFKTNHHHNQHRFCSSNNNNNRRRELQTYIEGSGRCGLRHEPAVASKGAGLPSPELAE